MSTNVDDKIKLAIEECGGIWCYDISNRFKYIYPFTTENIAGYINKFNLKDKKLLTVGSSGDQVLNAILHDCTDISVIDLCPFAKEYFYLKKAAIETFSREEYLSFFCYLKYSRHNNNNALCKFQYERLRDKLTDYDEEVAYFWNALYSRYKGLRIRKRIFSLDEVNIKYLPIINEYLISDTTYDNLRKKLEKIDVSYEVGNLFNINIDKTFDVINLSNIIDSCSIEKFSVLVNKMINCLNPDGVLLMAYLYALNINNLDINQKMRIESLKSVLPMELQFSTLPSISHLLLDEAVLDDSVVTYKKVKKIGK